MRLKDELVIPLITAAFLAMAAWVYTTGNRVTALEVRQPTLEENLKEIRQDVKDIRAWLMGDRR